MGEDSLIAPVEDSHTWLTGNYMWDDATALVDAIESGDWKDQALTGTVAALDLISVVLDPLGSVIELGISWLMEQIEPVRQWLDELTGDADVIASHVETWKNIAKRKLEWAERLRSAVEDDLGEWQGAAADAYREKIQHGVNAAAGLAGTAYAIAAATEAAGVLVATTRDIVRDLIANLAATLMARLPSWIAQEAVTMGGATPAVAAQIIGWIAGTLGRIISYSTALYESLTALKQLMEWLPRWFAPANPAAATAIPAAAGRAGTAACRPTRPRPRRAPRPRWTPCRWAAGMPAAAPYRGPRRGRRRTANCCLRT